MNVDWNEDIYMKRICCTKSVLNANLLKTMVAATLVGLSLGTASFAADANSLSLVGEGNVGYGQPQSNQTSTASGTFSYSLGEGKVTGFAAIQFPHPVGERARERGYFTGFAVDIVPELPTRGNEAGYTVVDSASASNTGISFVQYEIDRQTKQILSQTTKYINVYK